MTEATAGQVKVGYWAIRGLAQPIRQCLACGKVDFEDVIYTQTDDLDNGEWLSVKYDLGINFPNLPYLAHEGELEKPISESVAILMYAGDLAGIHSSFTPAERATALSLALNIQNVRNKAVGCFYGYADNKEKLDGYMKKSKETFAQWEEYLGEEKTFLMGKKLCAADFHLAEMVYQHMILELNADTPQVINGECPNLMKHAKEIFNLDGVKEFEKKCRYPINNKSSKWGGKWEDNMAKVLSSYGL